MNTDFRGSETRAAEVCARAVEAFSRHRPDPNGQVQELEAILRSAIDHAAVEYTAAGRFATGTDAGTRGRNRKLLECPTDRAADKDLADR